MANTFLHNQVITTEALDVLENTDAASRVINRKYSDQFKFGGAVLGQTLNIKKPPRYIGRLGQAANIEGITETFVPLTLAYQRGVDTQVTSQDLMLRINDYRETVLVPQVARIANLIDQDVCGLAQGLNQFVGTPGVTPTALQTFLAAKTKLDNSSAPADGKRKMILNPAAEAGVVNELKGLLTPIEEIKEQYLSGEMGRCIGFNWMMDQNVYVQQIGTFTGTPLVDGANQSGASILTKGWTSGDTLKAGDIVSFVSSSSPVNSLNIQSYQTTGQTAQFVVAADCVASGGGAMTIPVGPAIVGPLSSQPQLQNVTNLPADNTPVYVYNVAAAGFATISGVQSPQNLAVHKDFGTLAMVDMPLPGGTDKAYRAASKKTGNTIRVIRDYVSLYDLWIQRLDVLYGVAVLRQELGVRIGG